MTTLYIFLVFQLFLYKLSKLISYNVPKNEENAAKTYATGCALDSEEVIKNSRAAEEDVFDMNITKSGDTASYTAAKIMLKAAAVSSLPSKVDLTNEFPIPGHQGQLGSCVTWAVGYALKSHQEYVEHSMKNGAEWDLSNSKTQYSPAFIYSQYVNDNNGDYTTGVPVSTAMDMLAEDGICSLYSMKYNGSKYSNDYKILPNASQEDMASNFKAEKSYLSYGLPRAFSTVDGIDEIKAEVNKHNGVVIVIPVYKDFSNLNTDNDTYDVADSSEAEFHAICVVGYDDNHIDSKGKKVPSLKFINSWG